MTPVITSHCSPISSARPKIMQKMRKTVQRQFIRLGFGPTHHNMEKEKHWKRSRRSLIRPFCYENFVLRFDPIHPKSHYRHCVHSVRLVLKVSYFFFVVIFRFFFFLAAAELLFFSRNIIILCVESAFAIPSDILIKTLCLCDFPFVRVIALRYHRKSLSAARLLSRLLCKFLISLKTEESIC